MRKPCSVPRARISPMPVLPVFFRLKGKAVVLAGGGADALWKAELLLAAGAEIRLYTDDICAELESFLKHQPGVTLQRRRWRPDDFNGAALAVGACDNDDDAERFAEAARAAGVPVNTIDKPDACDFQFGSVVNRGSVLVSISTGGAAPALAQAIRRRIETILPERLADWAEAAVALRQKLSAFVPDIETRRAFWRRFADKAFFESADNIGQTIDDLLQKKPSKGRVTLVGAGPGAADLLTLRAVRALQCADVILFDDLISDDVLELARREAKRITVGKRGGRASCGQDDINALMVKLAKQGKRVVRLKSGDPMVFGRGGEEIAMLEAAGVETDVVPGVTAATAAASVLKTSLTHRDVAQGVKFITAHAKSGELPDLDWRACADPNTTLMVYMGARTAGGLAARLLAEGLDPLTPVIVAAGLSRPEQRIHLTDLSQLQQSHIDRASPVLIGVGRVFSAAVEENLSITDGYMNGQCGVGALG